ncbi:TMEM165/GDT1 family protein [Synechococcales cyanobacterium C]|uniref:GDT1 family protein n=1 Tax=Petrachloros mirabilis ULC683 TaxID=2781853 RepID=A0A8K1ZZH1_9CYAN|nr:TMEM165/GDT1 family protein [Petrachloros mirabilis]NCJ06961.1 TMEM165/GDT1 family protein [Petrachloros mirabilis ULC683]
MPHLPVLESSPEPQQPSQAPAPQEICSSPQEATLPPVRQGWLPEFMAAFLSVFVAELGDKTQLATLLMSAESQSPWVVFAGAATALITTSLLGVLVGRWLSRRLSPQALQTATGASLLLVAILLLWDVVHL